MITEEQRNTVRENNTPIHSSYLYPSHSDQLETYKVIRSISKEIGVLVETHHSFKKINPAFKAAVADLRCFLETIKDFMETPALSANGGDQTDILQILFETFRSEIDKGITRIDDIVRALALTEEEIPFYKSYYQKHLLALLLTAPINHRSYHKPEGYAGDYEVIRMAHEATFSGTSPLGKILNKYTTSSVITEAARKRTAYLGQRIFEIVSNHEKEKVEVFSIGSGPALEIRHLMENYPEVADRISLTLLDQEIKALRFAEDHLTRNKACLNSQIQFHFIHQSLQNYLKQYAGQANQKKFDVIYAFGIFDYFEKDIARFITKCLLSQLNRGGRLLISNVSLENNRFKTVLEFGLEWYLVYRDNKDLAELAEGFSNTTGYTINDVQNGMIKVLEIQS